MREVIKANGIREVEANEEEGETGYYKSLQEVWKLAHKGILLNP